MTFHYTNKISSIVIELIEEGEYTLKEIANICNVSIGFVLTIKNNYDSFYVKDGDKSDNKRARR